VWPGDLPGGNDLLQPGLGHLRRARRPVCPVILGLAPIVLGEQAPRWALSVNTFATYMAAELDGGLGGYGGMCYVGLELFESASDAMRALAGARAEGRASVPP